MRLPILGASCVLGLLTGGPGSAAPVTIRPQQTATATNVANPANALDDNPATFAAISVGRVCRDDHETSRTGTLTLDRFPAGYRAVRVEVSWNASTVFAVMQDNTAAVTASVDYNAGEGWRPVESTTWTASSKNCPVVPDGSLPCLDHTAVAAMPKGLDAARVRVRITLMAAFSKCTGSGPSGIANLVANGKIYDVRMIAEKAPAPRAAMKATGRRPSRPKAP